MIYDYLNDESQPLLPVRKYDCECEAEYGDEHKNLKASILKNIDKFENYLPYASSFLNVLIHNLKKTLNTLAESMLDLCIYDNVKSTNKLLIQYHELIKPWIEGTSNKEYHNQFFVSKDKQKYFVELQELQELQNIFDNPDLAIAPINVIINAMEIIADFLQQDSDKILLQNYAYVVTQQMEHIKFHSLINSSKLNDNFIHETINICGKIISEQFLKKVKNIALNKCNDILYYQEALKYLDMYIGHKECQKLKANALVHMGDIYCKQEDFIKATNTYTMSLKYNKYSKDVYHKVGMILFDQEQYEKAIKFFTVIDDLNQIKKCYECLVNFLENRIFNSDVNSDYVKFDSVNPEDLYHVVAGDQND